MFQVLNKVTGGKPCATRRSSGGRRVILKALLVEISLELRILESVMCTFSKL